MTASQGCAFKFLGHYQNERHYLIFYNWEPSHLFAGISWTIFQQHGLFAFFLKGSFSRSLEFIFEFYSWRGKKIGESAKIGTHEPYASSAAIQPPCCHALMSPTRWYLRDQVVDATMSSSKGALGYKKKVQSWALEVFLNFFNDKKWFFCIFYQVNNLISAPVLFKKSIPSQINLIKNSKNIFLILKS